MPAFTDVARRNISCHEENPGYFRPVLPGSKRLHSSDDDFHSRHMAEQRNKRKNLQERRLKRARTSFMAGRPLPVSRLVEAMDKTQLKNVLETVIAQHPEVEQTIYKNVRRPSTNAIIGLVRAKAAQIAAHLPYKCDIESDYSYIRVKPYLTEFLNCISDFILNLLPPMDFVLSHSCVILHVITGLIHELPNFSNTEFQYTKSVAYQQLANLWLIVLSWQNNPQDAEGACEDVGSAEASLEWLKTVQNMKLLELVEKHNESSAGKFAAVVEHIKTELGTHAVLSNSCSPEAAAPQGSILSDLITVDYSSYSIAANTYL